MATQSDDGIIEEVNFVGLGKDSPVKIRLHKNQKEDQELLEKGAVVINCLDPTVGYINEASGEAVNGFGVGWENIPEEIEELIDNDMRDHLNKGGHLYLTVPAHCLVGEWTESVIHKLKADDPASYFNGHIEETTEEESGEDTDGV